MDPNKKSRLMLLTTAAKHIIFNAERMEKFLPMLNTRDGAIKAVQAVIGVIDRKQPVPPDVAPLLGVNIYMLMVDMAQEVVGQKPDVKIVRNVIQAILQTVAKTEPLQSDIKRDRTQPQQPAQQQQPQPAQQPAGLMGA